MNPIASALRDRRVVVTVGSGGVGKTTVAASLALRAASGAARSSLVLTIDPARRLANSLGMSELGNEETRISEALFHKADIPVRGSLFAMMLDMKRTWDELVIRHASPDKREKILSSRFYQALSTRLAGSQEYIAMEKLCELRAKTDYELIVLDTPPTAHALDFLDAPNRVLDFLDNEAAKWLLTPALAAGKVGLRFLNFGSNYAVKTIAKLTGTEMLQELAAFMQSISGLNDSFRERARQVRELLSSPQTSFVLVTAPTPERIDEVIHFHRLLQQHEMHVSAIVVNRMHALPSAQQFADAEGLAEPLRAKMKKTLEEQRNLAEHDASYLRKLAQDCAPTPLVLVPRFERDVHDLAALWHTSRYLIGELSVAGSAPDAAENSTPA